MSCGLGTEVGVVDEAGRGLLMRPDCPCVEDPDNACVRCKTEALTRHLQTEPEPDEPDEEAEAESAWGEDDDEDRDDGDGDGFRPWSPQTP